MNQAVKDGLTGLAELVDSAPAPDRVPLVRRRARRRRRARASVTAAALTIVTVGGLGLVVSTGDRGTGTVARQVPAADPIARVQAQVISEPGARTVRLRIKVTGQAYPLRWLKTGALLPGPQTGILSGTVYHFEGVPKTRTFDRPPGEQYTCVYSDPQLPIDVTLEDSFTYSRPGRYTVAYSFGVCAAAPGWPLDRRYLPAGSLIGGDLTVVVR
jgi:hypothetical protein